MSYQSEIKNAAKVIGGNGEPWSGIDPQAVARMRLQNRFACGLDIARYTADIMRRDMAAYDADPAAYTQSLGCWHGFIAQQKMIAIKKHFGTTKGRYLYLSGWMIAALRSLETVAPSSLDSSMRIFKASVKTTSRSESGMVKPLASSASLV